MSPDPSILEEDNSVEVSGHGYRIKTRGLYGVLLATALSLGAIVYIFSDTLAKAQERQQAFMMGLMEQNRGERLEFHREIEADKERHHAATKVVTDLRIASCHEEQRLNREVADRVAVALSAFSVKLDAHTEDIEDLIERGFHR